MPSVHFFFIMMLLHFKNVAWVGNGGRVDYYIGKYINMN